MNEPKPKHIQVAHHRNGISGIPFHVCLFDDENRHMIAVLFDDPQYCAVFDVNKLANGDIAFGSNSWRGDEYEPDLRQAIEEWEEKRVY